MYKAEEQEGESYGTTNYHYTYSLGGGGGSGHLYSQAGHFIKKKADILQLLPPEKYLHENYKTLEN